MFKILLFCFLFNTIKSEEDYVKFLGEWMPVVTYPDAVLFPICQNYTIAFARKQKCICNGRDTTLPLTILKDKTEKGFAFPTIIVKSADEVEAALNVNCKCGNNSHHVVFRWLNEDYFVQYEKKEENYTEDEPNTANVFARKTPTLTELEALVKSVDDLKNRGPVLFCDELKP